MAARIHRVLPRLGRLKPASTAFCAVCFSGIESPLLDAAQLGVLTMAGLVLVVLGAFAGWFVRLAHLEREAQQTDQN